MADWPILARILVGVVLVLVLVLGILTTFNVLTVQSDTRDATSQQFQVLARAQLVQLGDFLSENVTIVRTIALTRRVREDLLLAQTGYRALSQSQIEQRLLGLDAQWLAAPDSSQMVRSMIDPSLNGLTRQLVEYFNAFPDHVEIFVTDLYGGLVASTGRTSDYYQADEGWWQAAYRNGEGAVYISQPEYDESAGYTALDIALPVRDDDGTVLGIVRSTLRVESIQELVSKLKFGETGHVALANALGVVIADPNPAHVGEQLPESWYAAGIVQSNGGWAALVDDEGERVLAGYATLGEYESDYADETEAIRSLGWILFVRQSQQEALETARNVVWTGLGVAGLSLLIAFALAFVLARSVSQPIRQLVDVARQMTGGNLQIQVPFRRRDEVGELALAFEDMAGQVLGMVNTLEQRVADRTRNLETAAEVSRATTAVLDLDVLLPQVVELARERFGYYYVGLFLVDDRREFAVLQAGTGEAGHQMMAQGWQLAVGEGSMIGRCVSRNEAEIALDVGAAPSRFDNPFLPDTRSEMALPLRARGSAGDSVVIGAMTVQSAQAAAFDEADIALMQTVADQVATAISNARLFRQAQDSLEAERRAYGELSQQAWQALLAATPDLGFVEDANGLAPVGNYWDVEMIEAVQHAQPAAGGAAGELDPRALAVPILSRGQVVAVIDAHLPKDVGSWTPEQVQLLQSLADQLGVALESARLYQDTQRTAARERLIGEVTARVRETLDVETVLQTATEQVFQALGLDEVVIQLVTEEDTTPS
ncbi:MAG: GAF domain-containing protein [Anaerolineae bacterium]|nr:GAF domain-containing protein [Anaerolineae bacterium]